MRFPSPRLEELLRIHLLSTHVNRVYSAVRYPTRLRSAQASMGGLPLPASLTCSWVHCKRRGRCAAIPPLPSRRGFSRPSPLSRCASVPALLPLPPLSPPKLRPQSGRAPCSRLCPPANSSSSETNQSGAPLRGSYHDPLLRRPCAHQRSSTARSVG